MINQEERPIMRTEAGEGQRGTRRAGPASFLLRMWREAQTEGEGPVRVYLRNLQTGEELYLGSPARVGEVLAQEAGALGRTAVDTGDFSFQALAR